MEGQHIMLFCFVISVLLSTCSAASFQVIEDVDYLRAKPETGTTVNTHLVDGKDIVGVRDGSDILAKDTNPALSATDGSDIVNKDVHADLKAVDGQDIAGIRGGSDTIPSDTKQEQNLDKQTPVTEGTEKTAVVENVEAIPEVSNQAPVTEGKEKSTVSEGTETVPENNVQHNNFHNFFVQKPGDAQIPNIRNNPYLMKAFSNHRYHQGNDNNYQRHFGGHHEATTPDPEGHETTADPEQHETTTPDPDQHVQPSWKRGWFNPLFMTRPGELPPMALPMTAPEGGDKPVALALTSHSEKQEGHQEQQHSEQKPEHTGSTDGNSNQDSSVHRNHGSSESVVHEMPKALALTSHSEGQEQAAPVAMGKNKLL